MHCQQPKLMELLLLYKTSDRDDGMCGNFELNSLKIATNNFWQMQVLPISLVKNLLTPKPSITDSQFP